MQGSILAGYRAMLLDAQAQKILAATVSGWFRSFGGISALDVANSLELDHDAVLRTFEELVESGHGSMNSNVTLHVIKFDTENPHLDFEPEPVVTHIFLPSEEVLKKAYYSSDLAQQRMPEYTQRLHLGANQIGLAYFTEEVLARYLDHPELYEVNDSLAGGDVSSLSSTPDDRYLYVRYGRRRLTSGHVAVTAIFKDLSSMAAAEQRYWHAHEIEHPEFERYDAHFGVFVRRTYDGEFVDYYDPFEDLLMVLRSLNAALPGPIFKKIERSHLRMPVEQTYKSYCDAASELYKVLGPDNLDQPNLKSALVGLFGASEGEFTHEASGRPLSSLQLLELLEAKAEVPGVVTTGLRKLSKLRIEADHKILEPRSSGQNYSTDFGEMCEAMKCAFEEFAGQITWLMR